MNLFDKFRKKDIVEEEVEEFKKIKAVMVKLAKHNLKKYKNDPKVSKEQLDSLEKCYIDNFKKIDTYIRNYEDYSRRLNELVNKDFSTDSKEYQDCFNQKQRWRYTIMEDIKSIEFMRPNTNEDALERSDIYKNYGNDLMHALGEDSDLRFHGTPIYYAKDIIKSKSISGSADRYEGYIKSTDLKGEFSASTVESVDRTIKCFLSLGSDLVSNLPCGVLFVLREKQGDESIRQYSTMQNIDFNKNPEQLVAILSTNENIENLTKWCMESNLDVSLVHTFSDYLENIRKKSI